MALDFSGLEDDQPSNAPPAKHPAPALEIREPGKTVSAQDLGRPSQASIDAARHSSFPSRQPQGRVQINAYMDEASGNAFKELCRGERYSYGEMIAIMMRHYLARR